MNFNFFMIKKNILNTNILPTHLNFLDYFKHLQFYNNTNNKKVLFIHIHHMFEITALIYLFIDTKSSVAFILLNKRLNFKLS